jgi:hypothetical protein
MLALSLSAHGPNSGVLRPPRAALGVSALGPGGCSGEGFRRAVVRPPASRLNEQLAPFLLGHRAGLWRQSQHDQPPAVRPPVLMPRSPLHPAEQAFPPAEQNREHGGALAVH